MQQKPRSQRTCTSCPDAPLGDEVHFILRCSEPSLVEARDMYFENMRDRLGWEWDRGDNEMLSSRAQKNIFLPCSKPSTFISFRTFSSSFPINHPILSLYLSLLLSFPSFPLPSSVFPSSFLEDESISAMFLVGLLPRFFVFLPCYLKCLVGRTLQQTPKLLCFCREYCVFAKTFLGEIPLSEIIGHISALISPLTAADS